jgi:riboflavin kinase/FMN adenylyltransferase
MTIEISGKVIRGDAYGKKLGFPTANLDRRDFVRRKLKIKLGIWAGRAEFRFKARSYQLKAGIVIGPIDKRGLPKIEAHLIGFSGNLYGNKVFLRLFRFIRPFRKYRHQSELVRQIKKDLSVIKHI